MVYLLKLNKDSNSIKNWEKLIKKFNPNKDIIRDLKLNYLLSEKCLLNIEEINPPILIDSNDKNDILLRDVIATVKNIKLFLKKESIEKVEIEVKFLTTNQGKVYSEIKDKLNLKPLIINNQVSKFILN